MVYSGIFFSFGEFTFFVDPCFTLYITGPQQGWQIFGVWTSLLCLCGELGPSYPCMKQDVCFPLCAIELLAPGSAIVSSTVFFSLPPQTQFFYSRMGMMFFLSHPQLGVLHEGARPTSGSSPWNRTSSCFPAFAFRSQGCCSLLCFCAPNTEDSSLFLLYLALLTGSPYFFFWEVSLFSSLLTPRAWCLNPRFF